MDSELPDVHYNLGNAYYMMEKYDEAMKYYIKSIKLDAFCIKENFKEAIRCYKKSIKLDPKNFETYFNLGNSYFVIGWYEEALECYTMSGSLGYDNPDLKFAFSRVHIELGSEENNKEADKYLFELLKNDPNNNKYLFYYAKLKESSNKKEAKVIYHRILQSSSFNEKELPKVRENYYRILKEFEESDK
jgi:tetratricopeptide (TPR) repeat protein